MSRLIRLLISVGLLALVIALADWRAMAAVLRGVKFEWLGYALLLAVLDRLIISYRFRMLLAARGVSTRFSRVFRVQLAANFLGSFLPSSIGVDAVRVAALRRDGEEPRNVLAAALVDRATLVLATLIFATITVVLLAGGRIPASMVRFVYGVTGLAIILVAIALQPAVRSWIRRRLVPRLPQRFHQVITDVSQASLAYRHETAVLIRTGMVTLALFAVRILFAKAVAAACGVNLSLGNLLLVIPILWIVVMLPITIGGIGVQDAGYVVLMGMLGVTAPVAASMSIVEHVVSRAASLPGAFFLDEFARMPSPSQRGKPKDRTA
jgi:uncharacterized protein (TIRG00374 family)